MIEEFTRNTIQWFKCDITQPNTNRSILVFHDDRICTGVYFKEYNVWNTDCCTSAVYPSHWAELPNLPEE